MTKNLPRHTVFVTLLYLLLSSCATESGFPVLSGPYLGQRSPGNTAEEFAPGIVSTDADEVLFGFYDGGSLLLFERTAREFADDWIHAPVYRSEISEKASTLLVMILGRTLVPTAGTSSSTAQSQAVETFTGWKQGLRKVSNRKHFGY